MKKKWKRNLLLLCLTVIFVGLIGSGAALLYTEKERREARNVEIDQVNFNKLHAGSIQVNMLAECINGGRIRFWLPLRRTKLQRSSSWSMRRISRRRL